MDDGAPLKIGRYVLHGEIAAGGMAAVHFGRLVSDAGFAKTVAIKRLHRRLAREDAFKQSILEEGQLAARIRHPNVVPPLDVVAEQGELLLVMEYVHGESLSRLCRAAWTGGEKVPLAVGAAILANVLHGLHAAHEAKDEGGKPLNIVHRDVSPQNILVGADGIARVIDFGIAKAVTSGERTTAGTIKGKVPYLAPEQLEGDPATRRTDIYAAAVCFWEVLAGKRLFDAKEDAEILRQIISLHVKPPSHYNPSVPGAVDDVVLKAIARDPGERYATARDMALALEEAVHLATSTVVGAWAERLAENTLAERARAIAAVEAGDKKPGASGRPSPPAPSSAKTVGLKGDRPSRPPPPPMSKPPPVPTDRSSRPPPSLTSNRPPPPSIDPTMASPGRRTAPPIGTGLPPPTIDVPEGRPAPLMLEPEMVESSALPPPMRAQQPGPRLAGTPGAAFRPEPLDAPTVAGGHVRLASTAPPSHTSVMPPPPPMIQGVQPIRTPGTAFAATAAQPMPPALQGFHIPTPQPMPPMQPQLHVPTPPRDLRVTRMEDVHPPPAGALSKPPHEIPNVDWLPPTPKPKEKEKSESTFGRTLLRFVIFLLVVGVVGGYLGLPFYLRQRIIDDAKARGITVTIERVEVTTKNIRLIEVRAAAADLKGMAAHATVMDLGLRDFKLERVTIAEAEVQFDGTYADVHERLAAFRKKNDAILSEYALTTQHVNVGSARVEWKAIGGPSTSALLENVSLDVDRTPSSELGDDFRLEAPLVKVKVGELVYGSWHLFVERNGMVSKAKLKLDPTGSYAAIITYTTSVDGTSSVSFAVPPTSLADLRVPPGLFAGRATEKSKLDLRGEVTLGAPKGGPSGPRAFGGRVFGGAYGLSVFPGGLSDALVDLPLSGEAAPLKPATLEMGTLTAALPDSSGARTVPAAAGKTVVHIDASEHKGAFDLSGKTAGIACEKKGETALRGTVLVALDRIAEAKVTFEPAGTCTPKPR